MQTALETQRLRSIPRKDTGYTPRRFRRLFALPLSDTVCERVVCALWPWSRDEYPGKARLRAWLLGVENVRTADRYRKIALPKIRRRFLAERLRSKIRELEALVAELDPPTSAEGALGSPKKLTRKIVAPE